MRLSIVICICSTLFLLNSCNSSKSTKRAVADEASAINNPIKQKKDEPIKEVQVEPVKNVQVESVKEVEPVKEVQVKPVKEVESTKEKVAIKETKTAKQATTQATPKDESVLEKVNLEDVNIDKTKKELSKQKADDKASLVGKYKWLKRECCGRMRKVTTAKPGEEKYMTLTDDGKVLYSGSTTKKVDDTEYSIETNLKTFPDRPMLKMGKNVNALYRFIGDTLLIDRGYIDLDKNYWLKVE